MGFTYRTDFVLRSKPSGSEKPILLKPVGRIVYSREHGGGFWTNEPRFRGPFPGSDMAASFDLAAFRAIPHSTVEVVVFMSDTGEHRCKISDKERRAIR